MFGDAGLDDVTIDAVGNVRGWCGRRETGNDCVVLSAHLDTVFGPELDVSVSRRGPRLEGPGIADNARGLAALVSLGEALTRARVHTERPILLAATVGEEGSGDLRGVRHLLDGRIRPHAFIALDGAGIERIVHRALGARRYRVTYSGPGGHSWAAFGVANPANAVGRAVAAISNTQTHDAPRTTHAVARATRTCQPSGTKTRQARSASCAPCSSPRRWLKLEQRNLRRRTQPQRRPPVARPTTHVEPHRFEAVQPSDERLKQPHQQIEGEVLPAMCVPGELEIVPGRLCGEGAARLVRQQHPHVARWCTRDRRRRIGGR